MLIASAVSASPLAPLQGPAGAPHLHRHSIFLPIPVIPLHSPTSPQTRKANRSGTTWKTAVAALPPTSIRQGINQKSDLLPNANKRTFILIYSSASTNTRLCFYGITFAPYHCFANPSSPACRRWRPISGILVFPITALPPYPKLPLRPSDRRPRSAAMAGFMANFFPGGKQDKIDNRPSTPVRNNFITPVSTPQGSPSKKTVPPGANELPVATALEHMKLVPNALESPVKLGRPLTAAAPLSPGKSNVQNTEEGSVVDESVVHKNTSTYGSPLKSHGQENTPPVLARESTTETVPSYQPGHQPSHQPSHAALSRQQLYQTRDRPPPTVRRFNTSRGLTAEELEILQKPSVKRLVNVTQLCEY